MIYAGDIHQFVLSITAAAGANPTISTPPAVTVVCLRDPSIAVVTSQPMTLIEGTQKIYTYAWNTTGVEDGDYVAFVTYAADGVTVTSRYLDRVRLGDARVTAVVAKDSTVAKDATVAKDVTVAKAAVVSALPALGTAVALIKQSTDALPTSPANEATLQTLLALLQDVKDAELGTWLIDKTQNPKVLTLRRLNGDTLAQYTLSEDDSSAVRAKILPN
jgi:hypothetical protein